MNIQEAIEAPRFGSDSLRNSFYPGHVYFPGQLSLEEAFPESTRPGVGETGPQGGADSWSAAWEPPSPGAIRPPAIPGHRRRPPPRLLRPGLVMGAAQRLTGADFPVADSSGANFAMDNKMFAIGLLRSDRVTKLSNQILSSPGSRT